MSEAVDQVASLLQACAEHVGRTVPDGFAASVHARVSESEAALILRGLNMGLLSVEGNYLRTHDPHQGTAWLVEGNPVHPCWEYLPHAAAYVELVEVAGVPPALIRFETPDSEFNLDLAVLTPSGRLALLGEAKAKSSQLDSLLRLLPDYEQSDPGKAAPIARGGPTGVRREAWKLAHQLWALRPAVLWLVAPGDRRTFTLHFRDGGMFCERIETPIAQIDLPRDAVSADAPRITAAR